MSDLIDLTIAGARDLLASGELSSKELTQAQIGAMEGRRELNAFITETPEIALGMAEASDQRRAGGEAGMLEGIPVAIKDLFCTKDVLTTAGSHILDGFHPVYESTVTTQMFAQGVVMLGKTNLDEFAMGSGNLTSYYGGAINPWRAKGDNRKLVPGGSSGGSASAVAGRLAMGATGTDTGGSIRQPAAFTGIVGMKPTYGRCSRWGIVAFASSLDQAGPMARSVRDAAIMLGAMSGHDPKDSTSAKIAVPDFEEGLDAGVKGMTIGIPSEYRVEGMPAEIEALWQQGIRWLEEQGARTVEISLPHTKYALPTYYVVAPAEASSNLARYDGVKFGLRIDSDDLTEMYEQTRSQGFGAEVKRRILIGTYVLSAGYYDAYYLKAQKVRTRIADDFRNAWDTVDAILTPATPSAAFSADDPPTDPVAMYLNDVFTVP
ncbi:MAG: Asp-tRNA(Asn)/Glu-tRNA(Gln) amidotransferase subunit GatA, partial [Rhodospirillaceae bacterium]|nr:Asp-tRNA(Asn)/Glu-tRNA(Gln) amidotransferase subunit GatA [Rhodospirillaceae bacterium]